MAATTDSAVVAVDPALHALTPDVQLHGANAQAASESPVVEMELVKSVRDAEGALSYGLSFGGGSPQCPCIFVTQIRDDALEHVANGRIIHGVANPNAPSSALEAVAKPTTGTEPHIDTLDGRVLARPVPTALPLEVGDEIVLINGQVVVGQTLPEFMEALHAQTPAKITFRKLPSSVSSTKLRTKLKLSLFFKRWKQKIVDQLAPGLKASLNIHYAEFAQTDDERVFTDKLQSFVKLRDDYQALVTKFTAYILKLQRLIIAQDEVHEALTVAASHEDDESLKNKMLLVTSSLEAHKLGVTEQEPKILYTCEQFKTFLDKVIPDARQSLEKFQLIQSQYMAACLEAHDMVTKINEADASTGFYGLRYVLRHCIVLRAKHAKARADVNSKLDILDKKHVMDMVKHIQSFTESLIKIYTQTQSACSVNQQALDDIQDTSAERCRALDMSPTPQSQSASANSSPTKATE
eukprot:m.63218 g.63218  ORF g.63218 m.63218 type:complete len:466 (-) comp11942_c0_seq2:178-1575(-)